MNRKLLQSVREYKKESIMTPILVIFEVFMEVLIPLLMARIIDVGIANGDMGYILSIGVVLVIMVVILFLQLITLILNSEDQADLHLFQVIKVVLQ